MYEYVHFSGQFYFGKFDNDFRLFEIHEIAHKTITEPLLKITKPLLKKSRNLSKNHKTSNKKIKNLIYNIA